MPSLTKNYGSAASGTDETLTSTIINTHTHIHAHTHINKIKRQHTRKNKQERLTGFAVNAHDGLSGNIHAWNCQAAGRQSDLP